MMPTWALFMNRFVTTRRERKFLKATENAPNSTTNTSAVTSSGRFCRRKIMFMRRPSARPVAAPKVARAAGAIAAGRRR